MSKSEFAESSSAKKRGPGRPKKVKSSDTVITLDSDQPPELEPQVTIPPIKKRLQGNSSGNGDSKPDTSPQPHQPKAKPKKTSSHSQEQGLNPGPSASSNSAPTLKPKQMSIMAFVQKKKEEALEKRVSGYLSPASEASMEEEEVKKPSVKDDKASERVSNLVPIEVKPSIKTTVVETISKDTTVAAVKKSKTIEKPELKEVEKPSKKPSKQAASKPNQDQNKTPVVMVEPLKPSKPLKPSPKPETAKIEPEKPVKPEKSEKQTIKPDMVVTKTPTIEKMDIKNKVTEVVEKVAKKETATKATPTEINVDKEKKAVSDKKSIVVEPLVVEEKITGILMS
jgi:hypothetical protein